MKWIVLKSLSLLLVETEITEINGEILDILVARFNACIHTNDTVDGIVIALPPAVGVV